MYRTSLAFGVVSLLLSTACDPSPPSSTRDASDAAEVADTAMADATDTTAESDAADTSRPCDTGRYLSADGECRPLPHGTPAEACPSGRYTGGALFRGDGICLPEPPRGDAGGRCPSGEYLASDTFDGDGVCRPTLPTLEDWDCKGDWMASPAFVDADGNRAPPKGLDGIDICTPPSLPETCERGEMAPAGATGCERHGTPCPSSGDAWLSESDLRDRAGEFDGQLLYVSAEDGANGNGTRDLPYRKLETALQDAEAGDIVALSRGTHRTTIDTDKRIALVGACVSETVVEPPDDTTAEHIVDLEHSGGALVTNFTVTGPAGGILVRAPQSDVHLEALAVEETRSVGVDLRGHPGKIHLDRVAIRSTGPAPDGSAGHGLHVTYDAVVRIRESVISDSRETGLQASGDDGEMPDIKMTDSVVRGTRASMETQGIWAQRGAKVELIRSLVAGHSSRGLKAIGTGTRLVLEQVAVVGTGTSDHPGVGIEVTNEAVMTGQRTFVGDALPTKTAPETALRTGLLARNDAKIISLQQSAILAGGSVTGDNAAAFALRSGTEFSGEQLLALRHPRAGIDLRGSETELELAHSVIWRGGADGSGTGGLHLADAELRLSRSLVAKSGPTGLDVRGSEAEARLVDVAIRGSAADGPRSNWGLLARDGASVIGRRLEVADHREGGVGVIGGRETVVDLTGAWIRDATPDDVRAGYGVYVGDGTDFSLTSGLVEERAPAGILARGAEATVDLRDSLLRAIRPAPSTRDGGAGFGLYGGAGLTLRRVAMRDNRVPGLDIHDSESTVDVRDLDLEHAPDPEGGDAPRYGVVFGGQPAQTTLTRLRIASVSGVGLYFRGITDVAARDLVVRDTQTNVGGLGDGVYIFSDAKVTVERGLLTGNGRHGLVFSNSEALLSDLAVTGNDETGIVRQGESVWTPTRLRDGDNGERRERCRQLCYPTPDPLPDLPEPSDL